MNKFSLFLLSSLMLGSSNCAVVGTSLSLPIQKISEQRISAYQAAFSKKLKLATMTRYAMVGSVVVLASATAYGMYHWLQPGDQPAKPVEPAVVDSATQPDSVDSSDKVDVERLQLKLIEKDIDYRNRQEKIIQQNKTLKGRVKSNIIMGVAGGVSLGLFSVLASVFSPLRQAVTANARRAWYTDARSSFRLLSDRVMMPLEQMQTVLQVVGCARDDLFNVNSSQGIFHSYLLEIVNMHRIVVSYSERIIALVQIDSQCVPRKQIEHLKSVVNSFADKLSFALDQYTAQKDLTHLKALNKDYCAVHDALMLVVQSYTIAYE